MRSLFADIMPPGAICVETRKHLLWTALFSEEQHAIRRAGAKRRAEFISARACAREALGELGFPHRSVPKGADGAPIWPGGVVGSVTHCVGLRAVAIADRGTVASLGIDAEPNVALPDGVLAEISSLAERIQLPWQGRRARDVAHDRLLFSAKEAAFKCLFAADVAVEEFGAVQVRLCRDSFTARLAGRGLTAQVQGRWCAFDGFICTVASLLPQNEHVTSDKKVN